MRVCRQFERQYIFVAATMPSEGKKSVAAELQQKFPGLLWLAGRHLHEGLSTINADLGCWVLRLRFRSMQLSLLWMDFFDLAVGQ